MTAVTGGSADRDPHIFFEGPTAKEFDLSNFGNPTKLF
jgi:hypothetical protein